MPIHRYDVLIGSDFYRTFNIYIYVKQFIIFIGSFLIFRTRLLLALVLNVKNILLSKSVAKIKLISFTYIIDNVIL